MFVVVVVLLCFKPRVSSLCRDGQEARAAERGLRHGIQPALEDPGERSAHDVGSAVSSCSLSPLLAVVSQTSLQH